MSIHNSITDHAKDASIFSIRLILMIECVFINDVSFSISITLNPKEIYFFPASEKGQKRSLRDSKVSPLAKGKEGIFLSQLPFPFLRCVCVFCC